MSEVDAEVATAASAAVCREEFSAELEAALKRALAAAERHGASAAEVHASISVELSVTARNGAVDSVEHAESRGLSISVYRGQQSGSAQTNDLTDGGIDATVSAALDIASWAEADQYGGLANAEDLAREPVDLDLYHPWAIDVEGLTKVAEAMDAAARSVDPRIGQTDRCAVSSTSAIGGYANSLGFCGIVPSSRHGMSCIALAEAGQGMERDYWFDSFRDPAQMCSPEIVGRRAAERAVARLGARQAPTGPATVVFEAAMASSLISHLIGAISGGALYRKASFLLDAVGQPVLPERLSLTESPLRKGGYSSAWFDGEGVRPLGGHLVRDGVLERYVLSSYSGRRLGLPTTGNAGGVRNLTLSHDGVSLNDLIKDVERGVLITEMMGSGVNMVNGDYSRGATGFWIEQGEIAYPVNEFTVAGNLRDMLKNIVLVADDIEMRGNTQCGSMRVEGMTLAGA